MVHIAKNIKHLRTQKGLSQAVLSERMIMSRPTTASYETGGITPSLNTIIRLGKIFKVNLHDLCFKDLNNQIKPTI